MSDPWWKTAIGYQIYPRSFADSNGDGVGDIPGIIDRLDHLADLGVDFVWLSPIYASPMRDNGYDISDYYDIAPEFGTLADFDRLVAEAGQRGIRIVMDLVVNHCSSDHAWFQTACTDADAPEHDYFYWRAPGPDGGPPDDQRGCFGGPAWEWVEAVGKYYFCFFGAQQPDLNWQNPALRDEVYTLMTFWLDRGIGGFRMDVIDLIGKDVDQRLYFGGPDQARFLAEMHDRVLAGRDIMTIGESWSVTPDTALMYCGRDARALNMVFNFNHVEAAFDATHGRFGPTAFDLVTHKRILNRWQAALATDGWNSLYLSNHDLPRPVSFFGDGSPQAAKALALTHYLMRGTPFIFQGDEIGMTNIRFDRIEDFTDIETVGQYRDAVAAGRDPQDFIDAANAHGRDNARTPMQWSADAQGGFSTATPWMPVNPNAREINVAAQRDDPDSVLGFYKALIALRKADPVWTEGPYTPQLADDPAIFAFTRGAQGAQHLVIANLSAGPVPWPEALARDGKVVLRTHPNRAPTAHLAPYEGYVLTL